MTFAPPRPCPHPHCQRFVSGGGYCARHKPLHGDQRPSAAARGYDGAWTKLARRWLRTYPWCGQRLDGFHMEHSRCVQRGENVHAQVVDHIISLAAGGARLDPTNLQSLCVSCNTAKR